MPFLLRFQPKKNPDLQVRTLCNITSKIVQFTAYLQICKPATVSDHRTMLWNKCIFRAVYYLKNISIILLSLICKFAKLLCHFCLHFNRKNSWFYEFEIYAILYRKLHNLRPIYRYVNLQLFPTTERCYEIYTYFESYTISKTYR